MNHYDVTGHQHRPANKSHMAVLRSRPLNLQGCKIGLKVKCAVLAPFVILDSYHISNRKNVIVLSQLYMW